VTVPWDFNDNQKQATEEACRIAGLEVLEVMNEPKAAVMAYGLQEKRTTKNILVLDLSDTYKISFMRTSEGVITNMKAVAGDVWLGGHEWNKVLVDLVIEKLRDEHHGELVYCNETMLYLYFLCKKAKMDLS